MCLINKLNTYVQSLLKNIRYKLIIFLYTLLMVIEGCRPVEL